MKCIAVILVCLALAGELAGEQMARERSVETARGVVDELAARRFDAVTSRFDGRMRAALSEARLAEVWDGIEQKAGKFQGIRGVVVSGQTITLVCQFERSELDAVLTFNTYGQLAGLFFRPTGIPAWTAPAYAQTKYFSEIPVTVRTGRWSLPGTLTLPSGRGPFPGVVLVQGSGPEDQDESVGQNKPFKDLAWGLASRSIAVMRYTKRTSQYGAASSTDPAKFTVNDEILEDARSAVEQLAHRPEIDGRHIFLLGHSFGATMAPRLAAEDRAISGLILMAGAVTPIERLALEQLRMIIAQQQLPPGVARQQIAKVQAEIRQIESPDLKPGSTVLFLGAETPASYWLDLRKYHPDRVAAALNIPILILQGGRDYQVPPSEFAVWKRALAGHENAAFEFFPSLNHLFEPEIGPTGPEAYTMPEHVDEKVIAAIASWVKAIAGMK